MGSWTREIPFKVDIAGVIHIMGSGLYSRPDAAVRELIQNAHDAVTRRRQRELDYQGRLLIRQDAAANTLEFSDDGFGLSAVEAEQYLGTLGIGLTGLMKGEHPKAKDVSAGNEAQDLIGMFGIGLFSGFMLAKRMVVESRRVDNQEGVRWEAGEGTEIELSSFDRDEVGTTIRLHLKPEFSVYSQSEDTIEKVIKEYADFLAFPIFLNQAKTRANVIQAAWFEPTPDDEEVELALAEYFDETPLDVVPIQISDPPISGAIYISPQRTPGFTDEAAVTATIRRMVISRNIQGLLPPWASFLRGVLELRDCWPTASREDLVRNQAFERCRLALEEKLFAHFEDLIANDRPRMESILSWHRYVWAGAALGDARVRGLLKKTYQFPTSKGLLTFDAIFGHSEADPIYETEFDHVVWYNTDRRQESWVNSLFASHPAPCVHTMRSFEESLLAAMIADSGSRADLRMSSPSSAGFATEILHLDGVEDAPPQWSEYLGDMNAKIQLASFGSDQPVMAFLNERHELMKTFEDLKKAGTVPSGFQRLIDAHFDAETPSQNEVLLNRSHRLVARALTQNTSSPLASVLRLLVAGALRASGATLGEIARQRQTDDLDWIAECLWGKE